MKANQTKGSSDPKKPHAWIVNSSDRGRKGVKNNNKVYLQDGANFEIELYNPLTDSVLADIKVNGISVSKSGLIVRPGQRFYLDCFVDDQKKFVFNTYEVEDTDQSKQAISKNGTVEVFFYKEETINLKGWRDMFQPIIERRYYPVYYPYNYPLYNPYTIYYGTTSGSGTVTTTGSSLSTHTSNNVFGSLTNNTYSNGQNMLYNSLIETGRVEKGEKSNQKFKSVDMDFQKYHISAVDYQILPESQKPVDTKDLAKKSKKEKIKNLESQVEDLKRLVEQMTKK